jgi:hypothetical protein
MNNVNRREFLKLSSSTIIGLSLGGVVLRTAAQDHVKLDSPIALSLSYAHTSKVEGQHCDICQYLQGEVGKEWRPCGLFSGELVNAKGWCAGWTKQAA